MLVWLSAMGAISCCGRRWRCFAALGTYPALAASALGAPTSELATVTNLAALRVIAVENPTNAYAIRLEGTVWWTDLDRGRFVLSDASAAVELELEIADRVFHPGQRVQVTGEGTVARRGAAFRLGHRGPIVDNNGVHATLEKSASVFLKAGLHPIRVEWFNGVEHAVLDVECQGPGLPRQRIPDALLILAEGGHPDPGMVTNGVAFRVFAVAGEVLPDLASLTPIEVGTTTNFDISIVAGREHVGIQFTSLFHAPRDGVYAFHTSSDDGSRLFIDKTSMHVEFVGPGEFPLATRIAAGQALPDNAGIHWADAEGTVRFAGERAGGLELELESGTGRMRVEVTDRGPLEAVALLGRRVRARGVCQVTHTIDGQKVAGLLLVSGAKNVEAIEIDRSGATVAIHPSNSLPVLTSCVDVHRLRREEAQRGYPVRLRGVVTSVLPEHQAFTIQDATRGLYVVDPSSSRAAPPEPGEYLDLEGVTDPSLFAPIVNARRVVVLGAGHLPEPARPTWDQLMSGSMDAQFVELEGIVTAIQTNGVTLRTRGGMIEIELRAKQRGRENLGDFENALVRIRGCLFAAWDYVTHQVRPGEVRIYNASVTIDQPPPQDLFSVPAKTAGELRLFDPHAGVFQRVKVAGQILHVRDLECFLAQGGSGIRFALAKPETLSAGDVVEVVGFPEWVGSAAPVLSEAVVRKTGRAALPEPPVLSPDQLLHSELDSTRARVEGTLVNVRRAGEELVIEMRGGIRSFVARLRADEDLVSIPVGSRLEITGVNAVLGAPHGGSEAGSFELLLNSVADVRVLARPPWWTLERLLVLLGALAFILALTVLWITQLHRQVDERTAQLGEQIHARQRVEHQREMEQERARIAQDLHDELGSGITEISMLAARAGAATAPEPRRHDYLVQMGMRAREMVTALDEIVWAMNPQHDSLASLVSYFSLYAERFLALAHIALRLDAPPNPENLAVDSRRRHHLFLAFKEALTNVVRHAAATEVTLKIRAEQGHLLLEISDNGRGFVAGKPDQGMDGILNMRTRVEKLGGRFDIKSAHGFGTVVRFHVSSAEP